MAREASSRSVAPGDAKNFVGDKIKHDDVVGISEDEDVGERAIDCDEITFEICRIRRG